METHELDKDQLRKDYGIASCRALTEQMVSDEFLKERKLAGPINGYAARLETIMNSSGLTLEKVEEVVRSTKGPHKDEVLKALERLRK